jgi:hypothetical protein
MMVLPQTDDATVAEATGRPFSGRLHRWSRKVHYYLGLYLLLFTWFFAVSGLVLNHAKWRIASFWERRQEATVERAIVVPHARGDVAIAHDVMRQLAIVGEIGETRRSAGGAGFEFQVVRPGRVWKVEARLDSALAHVTEIRLDAWGVMDALHKFTGVRIDSPAATRDWWLTRLWSLAMDAVGMGLVVLVASGVYLWWRLAEKRAGGAVALALGVVCCAFVLSGLGTLFG